MRLYAFVDGDYREESVEAIFDTFEAAQACVPDAEWVAYEGASWPAGDRPHWYLRNGSGTTGFPCIVEYELNAEPGADG